MGSNPSTFENPQNLETQLNPPNPDTEIQNIQDPDVESPNEQNPDGNFESVEGSEKGQKGEDEGQDGNLGEKEGEERGECGFCLFMKGGGCKEAFIAWEDCVKDRDEKEDVAEKCFDATDNLFKCMVVHSDYYAPLLKRRGDDDDDEKKGDGDGGEEKKEGSEMITEEKVEIDVGKEVVEEKVEAGVGGNEGMKV